jgi:hypothetical protein
VGELIVSAPGMEDRTVPLVTGATVEKLGFFGRIMASLKHYAGLGA